jgi:uncharacterized protein (TIGR03086 family)
MDSFDALDGACGYCRARLAAVRASHFSLPTPCTGWTVRDLVNHVLGGQRRYLMLLAGASTAEVEATRHHDHMKGDPVASFDAAHAELKRAFTARGALDMTVHHRAGDRTGRELLLMRVIEYAVHGWDLSRAIRLDDTMPASLASFLADAVEASGHLVQGSPGAYARPLPVTGSASSPQTRLLALTGRAAGWTPRRAEKLSRNYMTAKSRATAYCPRKPDLLIWPEWQILPQLNPRKVTPSCF